MYKKQGSNLINKRKVKKKINKEKLNHKHQYQKVILEDWLQIYIWGKYCPICNKIIETNKKVRKTKDKNFPYSKMHPKDVHKIYPDFKIFVYPKSSYGTTLIDEKRIEVKF